MLRDIIAANVRDLREAKGWTLEELARRTKLSSSYISRIERNTINITADNIEKFAQGFGVPPPVLLSPNQAAQADFIEGFSWAIRTLELEKDRLRDLPKR